jgi:hypothetical protein
LPAIGGPWRFAFLISRDGIGMMFTPAPAGRRHHSREARAHAVVVMNYHGVEGGKRNNCGVSGAGLAFGERTVSKSSPLS